MSSACRRRLGGATVPTSLTSPTPDNDLDGEEKRMLSLSISVRALPAVVASGVSTVRSDRPRGRLTGPQ